MLIYFWCMGSLNSQTPCTGFLELSRAMQVNGVNKMIQSILDKLYFVLDFWLFAIIYIGIPAAVLMIGAMSLSAIV